jgi:hypothetical protein
MAAEPFKVGFDELAFGVATTVRWWLLLGVMMFSYDGGRSVGGGEEEEEMPPFSVGIFNVLLFWFSVQDLSLKSYSP